MSDESGPRMNLLTAGLVAGFGILLVSQIYSITSIHTLDAKLGDMGAEWMKTREALNAELAKFNNASSTADAVRDKTLAALKSELEKARSLAARNATGRSSEEALRRVQEVTSRLGAAEQKLRESQAQVAAELNGVKQVATSANTNLAAVTTEVREVRDDIANTRTQLNGTIADLRRVTGDLGLVSGLIATNGKEIAALRQLGDRNYAEFTVSKSKDAVRVADVWVLLKKTDTGRNRYTIELRADDRKLEKRDRAVNEPVQFYVSNHKQPYELVVNKIGKNQIAGYLATPKPPSSRP